MKKLAFILSLTMVLGVATLGNADLINNGGGLIYDTDLNITWYDAAPVQRSWSESVAWAGSLTLGGVTGWRLPNTVDGYCVEGNNGTTTCGYNITTSEMGHLYYTELGNIGYRGVDGSYPPDWGLKNKGPFINLRSDMSYWSIEYSLYPACAWDFVMGGGSQGNVYKEGNFRLYALAVHEGNVGAPVPIPDAVWLLGSGLIGLIGLKRKFKN